MTPILTRKTTIAQRRQPSHISNCRRNRAIGFIALFLTAISLVATPALSRIRYSNLPSLRLNVAEVQIVAAYVAPKITPNIEHKALTSPQDALKTWAKIHVRAAGEKGRAVLVIHDASITEKRLTPTGGLRGLWGARAWIDKRPTARYHGHLRVTLKFLDSSGHIVATARASVRHSKNLMNDAKPGDQQLVWARLTEEMLRAVTKRLRREIDTHLAEYVR